VSRLQDRVFPVTGGPSGESAAAGVTVTPGYSNVAGAWTELIAATTAETHFVDLAVFNFFIAGSTCPALLDLGVGAGGAEVAVVSSVAVGGAHNVGPGIMYRLPVAIQKGARVSCRITSANASLPASATVTAVCHQSGNSGRSPSRLVPMGATVASSSGVTISTSNTWTEITASAPESFAALIFTRHTADGSMLASFETWEIGVGASGSEVTVGRHVQKGTTSESWSDTGVLIVHRHVPAGSRISVRTSNATATNIGVVILGVPYTS